MTKRRVFLFLEVDLVARKSCKNISYLAKMSRGTVAVGLSPAWVDVSEEITSNIQRVRVKMGELAKAHAKALMPLFGDGKEDQHLIEALTREITDLLKNSEKILQSFSAAGPSEDSNISGRWKQLSQEDKSILSSEWL